MDIDLHGVDLHIHTTRSDGTCTPNEVIRSAYETGLEGIALTDHNQFAILEPKTYGGMEVIPGAEFSTTYQMKSGKTAEVHVVGLFFAGVPKGIQKIFRRIPAQRKNYLDAVITKLNYLGISLSYEELIEYFPESSQIGRRHIGELLVKKGYASDIPEAFDRFIGNRSPYWVDVMQYMNYMPLDRCVRLICENQGFPILAHPYHYHCGEEDMLGLLEDFTACVQNHPAGMEVYYSKYHQKQRTELERLALQYDLLPSAASDRHTPKEAFERGDGRLLEQMKREMKRYEDYME